MQVLTFKLVEFAGPSVVTCFSLVPALMNKNICYFIEETVTNFLCNYYI